MKKFLLVGLFAVAAANATITPELVVSSNAGPYCVAGPGAGQCTYEYEAYLPAVHSVRPGDFFTIYDFAGFVSILSSAPGWSGSASAIGANTTSPVVIVPDDPTVMNITWTYNGPGTITGATLFTGFKAVSTFSGVAPGWYAGQTTKPGGVTVANRPDANGGEVDVPARGGGDDVVPEPMSMALLGSGLAAIGLLRYRKQS